MQGHRARNVRRFLVGGAVGAVAVGVVLRVAISAPADEDAIAPASASRLASAPPGGVTLVATRSGRSQATLGAAAGCSGEYSRIVPVAAKVQGVGSSLWRFDLGLFADSAASVDIAALAKNQANTNPQVVNVQVPANEEVMLQNVLGTLFNISNAGLGVRFCSGFPLVEGYFYNQGGAPGVVYGTAVPALDARHATRPFRPAYFHNLSYTPSAVQGRRVNIGATSNSNFNVVMAIDLYDGTTPLGTINHTLLPYEHRQFTNVHQMVGSPAVASGHAVVRLLTADAEVYSYALQVQNKSGDLVYQAANLAPPPVGPIADIFEGTWTGTWNNLTFGSSGPASWTIDINESMTPAPAIGEAALRELLDPQARALRRIAATGIKESLLGTPLPDEAGTIDISYGGNVWGAGPLTDRLVGRKFTGGLLFMGDGPKIGHYDLTLNETGAVYGWFSRVPNPAIRSYKTWGTLTDRAVNLDARIDLGTTVAIATNYLTAPPQGTPTPGPTP